MTARRGDVASSSGGDGREYLFRCGEEASSVPSINGDGWGGIFTISSS